MATLPGAGTPPAEGLTPRVVSDIAPPKVPSSLPPMTTAQQQQRYQHQSPGPPSQPSQSQPSQSRQPAGEANRSMAAHHRILALNRAWEEKRTRQLGGRLGDKDSDSSDSDDVDAVLPPLDRMKALSSRPQAAFATSTASSTPAVRASLPGKYPSNVPTRPVAPSGINETPVPLPDYTQKRASLPGPGKPDYRADHPSTRSPMVHKVQSSDEVRARARRFTEASVQRTFLQAQGTPAQQRSTQALSKATSAVPLAPASKSAAVSKGPLGNRRASSMITTFLVGGPATKASEDSPLSRSNHLRPGIKAEAANGAMQSAPAAQAGKGGSALALPPSTSVPVRLPRGNIESDSDWDGSPESDGADDDSDVMMLDHWRRELGTTLPAKIARTENNFVNSNSGLAQNLDGRSYQMLHHSNGPPEAGRGAIFPTGYKLHPPPLQYICPVRDCQRLLKSMIALAGHFGASHKGGKFNDNGDGTLSLVDTYINPAGTSPGIVVSQHPLPWDAEPAAEPRPPVNNAYNRVTNSLAPAARSPRYVLGKSGITSTGVPSSDSGKTGITPSGVSITRGSSDVTSYLHSLIATQGIPNRPDIQFMEKLPRLRDLPASWIAHHRGSHLETPFYASAMAYLTGDEVTGKDACRQRGGPTARLSDRCIFPSSRMPLYAVKEFEKEKTCVGCHYYSHLQRRRNMCEKAGNARLRSSSASADKSQAASPAAAPSTSTTPASTSQRGDATPPADAATRNRTLASLREPRIKRQAQDLPARAGPAPKVMKVSAGSVAQRDNVDLDEMEPWEFSPGRLVDDSGSENIAFSGAYLTNAQPVTVYQDVSINVIVVKPGSSNRWASETDKLRACTVAAGKIKVKVAESTFQVGPNGAFVIQPGQTALVENRSYFDATVHCTTVKDY